MVIKHHVEGYDNFRKFIDKFDSKGQVVHVYFCGSKLENGESWCDDCERAKPVIQQELEKADPNSHFVYVEVGDRPTWKDPNCPFRKDPKTKLMVLPTIVRWKCPQRLEGEQCEKPELVNMLFSEED
ncbi:thioredoxin domain-containing protein 17 [Anoplophora glabripennis]|uniref:Thioredoxin domain-containing protein 17 n=1 Tax=Anoplophora glabripennis TaxID=217634 RepID=V5GMV8_ANOGL|nr:thioredoxin domain-containing protein 17 [Anoplophora glabripennis]